MHGRSGPSTSTGKSQSWTRPSPLTSLTACNVNAQDSRGRTVLHLACTAPDGLEYVRLLLQHPSINLNLPDAESHWTPLHRALYNGNIPAAYVRPPLARLHPGLLANCLSRRSLLLLQRADTDRFLQDYDGYFAFDLYNSTLEGTKPSSDVLYSELYTWGTNRYWI